MKYFMMIRFISVTLLIFVLLFGCGPGGEKKKVVSIAETDTFYLFNGNNFEGWTSHLAVDTASMENTWSVHNGEIHCTGEPFGYLRTITKHNDFQLNLEWMWPEEPGNSGLFLYINDKDTVWPNCMEVQLKSGNAGDIINISEYMKEDRGPEDTWLFKHESSDLEKKAGEWNQFSITCKGDSIEVFMNGEKVNTLDGLTITKGFIGLQSEGKPINFRNIYLVKDLKKY